MYSGRLKNKIYLTGIKGMNGMGKTEISNSRKNHLIGL
jgi:hypothetical protein